VLREVATGVNALELGFDDIGSWEGIGVRLSSSPGIWRVSPKLSRNGLEKEPNAPRSNPESGRISNSRSWELEVDGMPVSGASWSIDPQMNWSSAGQSVDKV
jgi:hypothetical protein